MIKIVIYSLIFETQVRSLSFFLNPNRRGRKVCAEFAEVMTENEISEQIVGCAIKVHKALGPGLLESAYCECLYYELLKAELYTEKQKPLPLVYEEVKLECGYRLDFMVENKVLIEVKSVEALNDIHMAQILTYLKLSKCKLGLLINFNVVLVKNGIKRVVNKL